MTRARGRLLLPLLILLLSLAAIPAVRVYGPAVQLRQDVQALQTLSGDSAERSAQLEPLITQTARDYRELRGVIAPAVSLAPLLGWLPIYGGDLENAPALLDLGDRLLAGVENALPLLSALDAKTTQAPGAALLSAIEAHQSVVVQSQRDYAQASQVRGRIDAFKLSAGAHRVMDQVDELLSGWRIALDAAALAPAQMGQDRPRVYLLLAQNSDELRPTGGFISSVALVRVQQGEITVTDFQDSYAVDDLSRFHPEPPAALTQYMSAGLLLLRDSNWFPDFPTSARAALNIYRIDRGVSADGVIAVNFNGIPRLMEAVDGVTVEPGSERVDAANVMTKVRTYWAPQAGTGPTPEWWTHRKDFMGQLLDAVMQKIKRGDYSRVKLARALVDSIVAKDLLVYLKDTEDDPQVNYLWSGALSAEPGDALMITDSNVGFNKVDGTIDRRAEYAPTVDRAGAVHALLTLTYSNLSAPDGQPCVHQPIYLPAYSDMQQGCYWDYVRVIAPAGSQLIRSQGLQNPVTEAPLNGRAIFAGYLVLGRGETRTVSFEYAEPPSDVLRSRYVLTLEKEPGAPAMPLLARVNTPGNIPTSLSLTLERDARISIEPDSLLGIVSIGAISAVGAVLGAAAWLRRRKAPTLQLASDLKSSESL